MSHTKPLAPKFYDENGVEVEMVRPGRRRRVEGPIALTNWGNLARLKLTGNEWAVLAIMAAHVPAGQENRSYVTVAEIAEIMGIVTTGVSAALRNLKRYRIVKQIRGGRWEINHHLIHSGSFADWGQALDEVIEPEYAR